MNCKDMMATPVCLRRADGSKLSAIAFHEIGVAASQATLKASTRYADASGEVLYDPAEFEEITVGSCPVEVECVESQEYTFGLDNTGTRFSDTATYELLWSDGEVQTFDQTPTSGWTAQLTQWAAEIQTLADEKGVKAFSEPRFVDNPNPSNIDGTINGPGGTPSGLPGAPTESIAVQLIDGGMAWRYVNIQICPGEPVPVALTRVSSDLYGDEPYPLTTAGAILGPLQRFFICHECGREPVWYLDDHVTLAEAGQIPNCWFPCGTLVGSEGPPEPACQFELQIGCDNNNSELITDFTPDITRRAKLVAGEEITVDFFQPDPDDASALLPYEMQGQFVDCASGEEVPLPPVVCENPQVKKIWRLRSDAANGINGQRWLANAVPFGSTESAFSDCRVHVNGAADETVLITNNWGLVDTDFPATPGTETSQELYYAWIYLDKPTVLRDTNGSTGEFLTAMIGGCGQKPKVVASKANTAGGNTSLGEFVELGAGLYQIVFHVNDFSVNGGITLQESTDGGATFATFPMSRTYAEQPEITCECVQICDGLITELDGTQITFDPETMSWCEIECPEITVPSDTIPDYEFDLVEGCDNVDGDPANFVNITRETLFIDGVPSSEFYVNYGDENNQAVHPMTGDFVDCATGELIAEPPVDCEDVVDAGMLWRVKDTASLLTTVDYWGPPAFPGGGNSAPHDNVSNIFTSDGATLQHVNGAPDVTFVATYTDIRTSNANFIADVGAIDRNGTSGNDQIRVRGYVILNQPVLLKDTNPNTGERGGIWLNRCCAGTLDLLFEDTTDSVVGDTGIFDGVRVPAGIHYFEAVTSDLSAWQGFQLSASSDDGATYEPLPIYDIKPEYECIALLRCKDSNILLNADTGEVVVKGEDDLRCEPPACVANESAASSEPAPTAQEIAAAMLDEQRARVSGRMEAWQNETNTVSLDVPAGTMGCLKTINEYGTGGVYWTIDGTVPSAANGSYMSVQYGNGMELCGIDLSLVRLNGTSTGSDFSVTYEVWS